MKKYPVAFALLYLLIALPCQGQHAISELTQKLATTQHDSDKAKVYLSIANYYLNKNTDSAILAGSKAIALAYTGKNEKIEANAYMTKGSALVNKGKYDLALQCHFAALRIADKLNWQGVHANIYNNIAIVYTHTNDYAIALSYYKKALAIKPVKNDADSLPVFKVLLNIATVYRKEEKIDSANIYSEKALVIARKVKDSLGTAILLYNIADAYAAIKQSEKALPYIVESKAISQLIGDSEGIAYCNNTLGILYQNLHQYNESIKYTGLCLQQARTMGMYEVEHWAYGTQYINYLSMKNYKQALFYRNLEIDIKDSLNSLEKDKQINNIKQNYEVEQKQQQIDLLVKENENNKLKQWINFCIALLIGGLLLLGSFAYVRIKKLNNVLKRKNDEMHIQNNALEELNETKNKLFSIVGHDLKGPFSSFKGLLELIKSNQLTEEESKLFLNKLYDSFIETFQLLDNLLIWANTQVKGINVNPSVFNIWQTINQNIKLSEIRANEKNIIIETNENLQALHVHSDMYMTDIVIRNLLENAIKFSNPGGTVKILAENEGGFIKVAVVDNGKGISMVNQPKLFTKMSFNNTRGTAGEKGSGLGLHITKEMVERNDGKIWFDSTPNQGSTFYFTIPAGG